MLLFFIFISTIKMHTLLQISNLPDS